MNKKTWKDLELKGKRVLMRVDFNVPLDKQTGAITDDGRITAALPTIKHILAQGARLILVSHLGRPKGVDESLSMRPCAQRLSELLDRPVALAADVIGADAKAQAASLKDGDVLLLENVRYHKEETKNDPAFARELASLADYFVNDAFGTAHRAHASTAGVASFLPAVSGDLIARELEMIGGAIDDPKRPFTAILGGAKVSDKIGVIRRLLSRVDHLIIGGGMAYTFLAAQGYEVGTSLCERDKLDLAQELLSLAKEKGVDMLLPIDVVVATEFSEDAEYRTVPFDDIPSGWMGLDIGPRTCERFADVIKTSATVVWNGPMGVFEFPAFANGTKAIAASIASSDAVSIIGGGDSAAAVKQFGFADAMSHISTGGGASLELLEGKVLPGIDCLLDADPRRHVAAGNWKMNKGLPSEARAFLSELKPRVENSASRIIVAVPATALEAALETTDYSNIRVAAQTGHEADSGAYTGFISNEMLARMHVPYVLIGHSERRAMAGETDERVAAMLKSALHWGLRPILCCGESLEERKTGKMRDVLKRQIESAFADVPAHRLVHITVAYEPIWAIGTGETASVEQAEEACRYIRDLLSETYGTQAVASLTVLYGGSVNAGNAAELFAAPSIDGGLVGGASLKVDAFDTIAHV